ncbi:hypothetical protein LCGC14_1646530, partial [marine sediment metagenome]
TPTGNQDGATKKYVDDLTDLSLLNNSMVDALHRHSELSASDGTPDQAVVVDATGQVGIGKDSPDSVFHIKANIAGSVGSHSAGQIIIQNPTDNVTSTVVITGYESDGDGNPDQQLWYLGSSSSSNTDIIYLNRRNAKLALGTNNTTRITILGNGNVGIGTASPLAQFHVKGLSDEIQTIIQAYSTQTANIVEVQESGGGALLAVLGDGGISQVVTIPDTGARNINTFNTTFSGNYTTNGNAGTQFYTAITSPSPTGGRKIRGVRAFVDIQTVWNQPLATVVAFENTYQVGISNSTTGLIIGNNAQFAVSDNRTNITVTDAVGFRSTAQLGNMASVAISNLKHFEVVDALGTNPILTNQYGLYVNSLTRGDTLNYAIFTNVGLNQLGDQLKIDLVADKIGLIIQAHSTQTANIVEIQDSSSNVDISFLGGGASFNVQLNDADFIIAGDTEANLFRVDAGLDAVRLGDWDTNYTNFAIDGEVTFAGAARVMRSIDLEPVLATRPAANPPGEGTEDSFQTHDFNASTDESVYFHLELPHDYADAGTVHVHFDFFVDTAPASAKSVVWGVEYKKQSIGDNFDFGAGTTIGYTQISITTGTPANDKKVHQSAEVNLTVTGFVAGDYILLRLFRDADGTGGTDDFAADARVLDYHIEYLSDRLGEAT